MTASGVVLPGQFQLLVDSPQQLQSRRATFHIPVHLSCGIHVVHVIGHVIVIGHVHVIGHVIVQVS